MNKLNKIMGEQDIAQDLPRKVLVKKWASWTRLPELQKDNLMISPLYKLPPLNTLYMYFFFCAVHCVAVNDKPWFLMARTFSVSWGKDLYTRITWKENEQFTVK